MNANHLLSVSLCTAFLFACSPADSVDNDSNPPATNPKSESITAADAENALAEQPAACQLTMGFQAWEPYQYVAVGDELRGLDIEIAQAVVREMGCELDAEQATWRSLLSMLRAGEIDFVLGASKTQARQDFALFSDAYRQEQFVLFVRHSDLNRFAVDSVIEFVEADYKLGVVDEYYYGEAFRDTLREGEADGRILGAMMSELNIARLLDGEIDAFLEDTLVGASIVRRKGLAGDIARHPVELPASDVYVMFSKKSVPPGYVKSFNEALARLMASGAYDKIIAKYEMPKPSEG